MNVYDDLAEQQAARTQQAWERIAEVSAEQERIESLREMGKVPTNQPHHYGDRTQWRPVDDNPWGDIVNRAGYTPDGRQVFAR